MQHRLLDILSCPFCQGFPLRVEIKQENVSLFNNQDFTSKLSKADDIYKAPIAKEIVSGSLHCPNCHMEFEIKNGIPNFMCNESFIEDDILKQKIEYDNIKYGKSCWYPRIVIDRVRSKIDNSFDRDSFLLDLGTGGGVWANVFSKRFSVIGLDIDIFNLYNGKKKYPHIDFVCASATKLPFRNNSISIIFSGLFLHHLYLVGLDKIFKEIYRSLISGGQFLAYEPNKYHPVTLLIFNLKKFLIRHFGQKFVWRTFGLFQTFEEYILSPREVRSIAINTGFNCQIETCFGIPSIVLDKMSYLNKISQILEKNIFLAGSFFIDGRKR